MLKLFYRLDATVLINERNLICITKMDGASIALPASSAVINLYNRTGKSGEFVGTNNFLNQREFLKKRAQKIRPVKF